MATLAESGGPIPFIKSLAVTTSDPEVDDGVTGLGVMLMPNATGWQCACRMAGPTADPYSCLAR